MALDVNLFIPNEANLSLVWERIQSLRPLLEDTFPDNPFGFTCWIGANNSMAFVVGPPEDPHGLFVFTSIVEGDSAFCHILLWNLEGSTMPERIQAARDSCGAAMYAHQLVRLQGLTPTDNLPARIFAEKVGFKYLKGALREAVLVNGARLDAWVCDLLPSDLIPEESAHSPQPSDKIEEYAGG